MLNSLKCLVRKFMRIHEEVMVQEGIFKRNSLLKATIQTGFGALSVYGVLWYMFYHILKAGRPELAVMMFILCVSFAAVLLYNGVLKGILRFISVMKAIAEIKYRAIQQGTDPQNTILRRSKTGSREGIKMDQEEGKSYIFT